MSTARVNGSAIPSSRNPKRRPRNEAEDSISIKRQPKRLRRSELQADTFEPPSSSHLNGHVKHTSPLANGHADRSSQRDAASDTASLAIRNRGLRASEHKRPAQRHVGGTTLTKNDFYIVSQLPSTPGRFQNSQNPERWRGEIYHNLGLVLVTTQEHAIVWRYTQGVSSTETLKPLTIRLLNPSVNARQPLPLGILVPTSEEPALLVVVPATGKITYWDSISSAASVDSSRQKQNCAQGFLGGLMSGEVVTKVIEGEPHGFALPLNSGRVAHITISDLQGKPSIATHFLQSDGAQSVGFFGGLKNVFGSAGWRRNIAAVRAGFSAHRGHRQLVVATSKGRFQIWDLNWNGTQSLLHEIDGKADFLKSLVEGGEVFRDHQDHQFEVLDFTFSPIDLESKQTIIHKGKGDCQLWVLTVLHGPDSSKYNLIGVIIAAGSLAVHVVHPLACYKSLLSPDTEFKPQVLVPEEGFVAFVVFEKSVVLISLVEVEESPSSQLKVESNTLSDPFQDSIEYNKTRGYRNLACAAEAADGSQSSSCIFLVYGFGVIRFTALPMQKGQSAVDRATVTAATKIEQAMFFGTLPQNLLDFSGRPEIAFSQEQIERAAEDVSDAILKGESKYIPREMPSMESQLSRRAAALQDLIRHLKQRYGVLGRPTRWRLLWDAEKMAAAEAIWRTYQHMKEETKQVKHKNFLAEVIEVCSEKYKVENQVEDYETDGVRHWFVNDIWRLEYLLPYTDRTIQELIDEKAELGEGTDTITHARYIYEAIEIQIAALKTAFRFRELNLPSYDLASESVVDGVLLQGYENLDEPWTADGNVAARVKELTERAVKFLEDIDEPDYADNPILMKLRDNCPQQVQLFNQTQIEQFRWLKAHSDQQQRATGEALQEQYFELRKELFHGLADLGCGDQAVELAEKYEDMDALVELVELKRLSAMESFTSHVSEDNEAALRVILKTCDEQIISYFTKYGVPWADAYFSKHIANNAAGRVLEQSPMYQKALTAFLRRRPQYSKLRWINEVTAEGNYVAAAESLRQTQARETKLWFKKVELAMQKLTLLAATQQAQLKNEDAKAPLRSTEKSVAIIEVQEMFYDYLRPLLKSAIDVEAESDIVLAKYEDVRKHQHCIENIMKRDIARLVAREVLEPEDLIDTLIFMDPHGQGEDDDFIDHRFFLALKVLSHLDLRKSDPTRHELLESAIWRRCYIQNDWESINRTEDKDEEQTTAETEVTSFFITAKELYANDIPLIVPSPASLLESGTTLPSLRKSTRYASYPDNELAHLAKDFQRESRILEECLEKGRLEERYAGVVEAAKESVKDGREMNLEAVKRQRTSDAENVRILKERAHEVKELVNGSRSESGDLVDGEGSDVMDE